MIKREVWATDTHTRRMPCENEGRDQGHAFTPKGMLEIAHKPPEPWEEGQNGFFVVFLWSQLR